ncbi:MAG TPA: type III-B CRISPR module RAMP protein Cmr6 [Bryobacteraceae bacterium]|jgi:CRISPR-associated protein Cmr6|nr:type III-B CRISPR module RAMP protein Cmr6 [Bryobacteraceae bacterium]
MRQALEALSGIQPDHLGLAYDTWAPVANDGKVADDTRAGWLQKLAEICVSPDYARFFGLWKASFKNSGDRTFELQLASRLLVGHGNPSATGVGLTVHHTWGVPMIPGSALKGLLAHYVDAVYGPNDPTRPPWEQPGDEQLRADYQGNVWRGARIRRGPGAVYRNLFGAPDAEDDALMRERGFDAGASAGLVLFHDALYVPGSAPENQPFAPDVLTVHQKSYYDTSGQHWPNDYDSPNPVAFLTVRPGARLLLAVSGPPDWTLFAGRLLRDALANWGIGGKTSAGYGRLVAQDQTGTAVPGRSSGPPVARQLPRHQRGERVSVTRIEDPSGKGKVKFRADDGFPGHFAGEEPPAVAIGQSAEIWIANVSPQGYTLTLRPPKDTKK